MPRSPRPGAQHRRPGGGAGAHARPAVQHRRRGQRGHRGDGAGVQRLDLRIGACGVGKVVLAGRADRHAAIGMGHDVQPVYEKLRLAARVMGERQRLPLDPAAHGPAQRGRQVGQPLPAGGPDHGTAGFRAAADHHLGPPDVQRRGQRCPSLPRVHPGAQRIVDHKARGRGGRPAGEPVGGHHLPDRAARPDLRCRDRARLCQRHRRGIGQRLHAPAAGVACRQPARGLDLLPPGFGHQQAVKLELLLVVPVFGHMRGQRAHQPAA